MAEKQPSPMLNEVFSRAVVDDDFRSQLFDDRTAALSQYELTDVDLEYIDSVPRQKFDDTAKEMREGSVAGAMIGIGIGGHFGVDASPSS